MKKINKTYKEILDNPELRKRAEQYEASEYESDGEVDEEIQNESEHEEKPQFDKEEKGENESDDYDDDDDFKEEQEPEQKQPLKPGSFAKDGTGRSSSRFSRDADDPPSKSKPNTIANNKKGANESDDYEHTFDRESEKDDNSIRFQNKAAQPSQALNKKSLEVHSTLVTQ